MWFAYVEGESGERLKVLDDNGDHCGKPLLAFFEGLFVHCIPGHQKWFFARLESLTHEPICPLVKPLQQATCSYEDIDIFNEDEYNFYLHRHPSTAIPEAEFKKQRREFIDKFVEIDLLQANLHKLIDILKTTQMEAEDGLYYPVETMVDLVGLDKALELLAQRGEEKAIIRIA